MSPRGGGAARTSGLPGYASNNPNSSSSIGGDGFPLRSSGRAAPTAGILPPVNSNAGSNYDEVDADDFSLGLLSGKGDFGASIFGSGPRRPAGIVSTTWSTLKPRASTSTPNPRRPTRIGQEQDDDRYTFASSTSKPRILIFDGPNVIEQEQDNDWWDTPADTTWPAFDPKLSSNPFDASYWSSSSVNTAPTTTVQTPIIHVAPTATGVVFPAVEESAAVRSAGMNLLLLACLLGLVARRV